MSPLAINSITSISITGTATPGLAFVASVAFQTVPPLAQKFMSQPSSTDARPLSFARFLAAVTTSAKTNWTLSLAWETPRTSFQFVSNGPQVSFKNWPMSLHANFSTLSNPRA